MKQHLLSLLTLASLSAGIACADDKPVKDASPVYRAEVDSLGKHKYKTYREPVTVKTNSGRLIIGVQAGNRKAWPERSGQDLVIRYSDDKGKTWSPMIVAAEHGNYSCQSHGLVYDAIKNRLIFLYVTYNWDYSIIKGTGYKATAPIYQKMHDEGKPAMSSYFVYSDDEGKTWSKPQDLSASAGGNAHFGASEGRQLAIGKHAGRLILAGGNNRNMNSKGKVINKTPGVWFSDDHGKSWRFSEVKTSEVVSCEARVTERKDGSLLYSVRLRTSSRGRGLAVSKDGGATWSELRIEEALKTEKAGSNGCLITLKNKGGEVTETILQSIPRGPGKTNGSICISKDNGRTWPVSKLIVPKGYFKYSAMIQLDSESIGFFYETSHYKDIYYKKLVIDELLK